MKILVVEDEPEMAEAIVDALAVMHHTVDLAGDGTRASDLMETGEYDLVVLDWSIPEPNGIELLRAWREEGRETPVLMLTGRRDITDRVDGLDSGADDYLVKPFAFAEFSARIRSLLRRRDKTLLTRLVADDIEMDCTGQRVTVAGRPVDLSPKEFALLEHFLRHKDEVVSRASVAAHLWANGFEPASNVVDVLVHRLRSKIDQGRSTLLDTVPGRGYALRSRRNETP